MVCDRHNNALLLVCRLCCAKAGKAKTRIGAELAQLLRDVCGVDVLSSDVGVLPSVLCSTCKQQLHRRKSGDYHSVPSEPFNFAAAGLSTLAEANKCSSKSECVVCIEAYAIKNRWKDRRRFRQRRGPQATKKSRSPAWYRACRHCLSDVSGGHQCGKRVAVANADRFVRETGIDGALAARTIRRNADSGTATLQTFGKPLSCSTRRSGTASLSTQQLHEIGQVGDSLSITQLEKTRLVIKSTGCAVPTRQWLREQDDLVGHFFKAFVEQLEPAGQSKYHHLVEPTVVIRCTDVEALLRLWHPQEASESVLRTKFFCDYGQKWLKEAIELIDIRANSASEQLLIGVTDAPERSANCAQLFGDAEVQNLFRYHDSFFCGDFKMLALAVGIMQASCKFPCPWCLWSPTVWRSLSSDAPHSGFGRCEPRTLRRLLDQYEKLNNVYGGDAKKGSIFCESVEAKPAIRSLDYEKTLSIPSLHTMLGLYHTALDRLEACMDPDEVTALENALAARGCHRGVYFSKQFEGNAVRKGLHLLVELEHLFVPKPACRPYYRILRALDDCVTACFGLRRTDDYKWHIDRFKAAWIEADMRPTLKAHCLVDHVPFFLDHYAKPGEGMAPYSEQAGEHCHNRFAPVVERYKCKKSSANYAEMLRLAVVRYNVLRMNHLEEVSEVFGDRDL